MALTLDKQSNFKHFCRICKKGFACGRALGGHMRAHGIGDESFNVDDDDAISDWENKLYGSDPPGEKRMYALRGNPNRLRNCRACENCGKEFNSWKSFLEHGKCGYDDVGSPEPSPAGSDSGDDDTGKEYEWSKRKRSTRVKRGEFSNSNYPCSEEENLANCLMMLSNSGVAEEEAESSAASGSRAPAFVMPLSYRSPNDKTKPAAKGVFECKACKKVFNSHQALGGHRASHKKVKGCFAARLDENDDVLFAPADDDTNVRDDFFVPLKSKLSDQEKGKSKVHECSVCHRIFSSGQALGGHKRCHWLTSNSPETSSLHKFNHFQDPQIDQIQVLPKCGPSAPLDLNLPAPDDDGGPGKGLNFDVSTEIYLQPWVARQTERDRKEVCMKKHCNADEIYSESKRAKLGDLKDMGDSSIPWLQVGISSTTDIGTNS